VTPTRREQLIQKVEAWKAASLNRPMLVSPCDVTIGVVFNTDSSPREVNTSRLDFTPVASIASVERMK
jgi:hypothetical protein